MRLGSFRKPLRAVHFARHFRVTCSLHFGVVELHGGVLSNRQLLTGVHPRALQPDRAPTDTNTTWSPPHKLN